MTAEEFLSAPSKLRAAIAADMDHLAALRTVAERCTSQIDLVSGSHASGSHGKLEDIILRIAEEEEKINTRIADLAELEKTVTDVICQVPNALQRSALLMRYMQGLSLKEIASRLYVSKTTGSMLHKAGIKAVEAILQNKEEGGETDGAAAGIQP